MPLWPVARRMAGFALPAAVIFAACAASGTRGRKEGKPMSDCLEKFKVLHSASVLQEQRRTGPPLDDFPARYPAAAIDSAAQIPVAAVAAWAAGGKPILWFTLDRKGVVVDAAFSGDLELIDAPRLAEGETKALGKLTPAARGGLAGRALARFLIAAGVVRPYWHVEAELCLAGETKDAKGYEAVFKGEHVYFTDRANRKPVRFAIRAAPGGELFARGL